MRFLPIHLDTQDQTILVAGGGGAAEAKLRTLVKTDAKIEVFAQEVSLEINRWSEAGRIKWRQQELTAEDIKRASLIYAATHDAAINSKIAEAARGLGVFVNAADQKEACDFYSPAIVDRSPVVISIGTEGTAPGLARALKSDIDARLPSSLGKLAQTIQVLRTKVADKFSQIAERQAFWADLFSGKDLDARLKQNSEQLTQKVEALLGGEAADKTGHVSLVGAGPGDPDLITVAARHALHSADVVVYDRLVSKETLDLGRREAEYIYVGKIPGGRSTPQPEINDILISKAKEGLRVVRLKSGDPLVFGRADEEIAEFKQHGIGYNIVPGITAAAAAAAEIGASLTSRGHNKSVALLTGHDAKGFAEHDWKSLSLDGARAAIYMGVGASRFIQGRLMLHGASPDLPISVVENASRKNQIIVATNLSKLSQDIEKYEIKGPAILLIGYQADVAMARAKDLKGVAV